MIYNNSIMFCTIHNTHQLTTCGIFIKFGNIVFNTAVTCLINYLKQQFGSLVKATIRRIESNWPERLYSGAKGRWRSLQGIRKILNQATLTGILKI